jgi:4-hydroxysphinganine ceramide fatty acyl 2-hydroxylase
MLLTFLRHGSVAALVVAVAVEALAFLFGALSLKPLLILLGALLFYLSEYGMHRFAFHAPPLSWPLARKLQHRLHYDHHVEPARLDLLFLPIWFLVPNLAVATAVLALIFGLEASASALLGMMLAILHYEWVHYVAHIPYQPPDAARTLDQAVSSAPPFHQREALVRRQQSVAGRLVRHVSRAGCFGEERNDPQALFLKRGSKRDFDETRVRRLMLDGVANCRHRARL